MRFSHDLTRKICIQSKTFLLFDFVNSVIIETGLRIFKKCVYGFSKKALTCFTKLKQCARLHVIFNDSFLALFVRVNEMSGKCRVG
mgnify:CR=1 FL=1